MKQQLWFWSGALAVAVASAAMMSSVQAQDNASSPSAAASAVLASNVAVNPVDRKAMKAANRKLAYAVRKRIEHVKGLDATHITIVAHASTVTLTGSAPDEKQIGIAIGSAQAVPGVTSVVNRLEVGQLAP